MTGSCSEAAACTACVEYLDGAFYQNIVDLACRIVNPYHSLVHVAHVERHIVMANTEQCDFVVEGDRSICVIRRCLLALICRNSDRDTKPFLPACDELQISLDIFHL